MDLQILHVHLSLELITFLSFEVESSSSTLLSLLIVASSGIKAIDEDEGCSRRRHESKISDGSSKIERCSRLG